MVDIESDIAALPIWRGPPVLEPLRGGLSNSSFIATDCGDKYVVRLTRDFPFHHVSRDREVMSARAAHAAGFGPEIVYAASGVMVSRFIDGRVLDADDVQGKIPRIAALLRRFHSTMTGALSGPAFLFWVFHVNRDYICQLRKSGSSAEPELKRWYALNAELEAALEPMPLIVGHHDLLPANLIDDSSRLWLIDYEYTGLGTAMFDLGNLSSNAGFDAAQSAALLEAYFERAPTAGEQRAHRAMEAASLLREALWSLVSLQHLDVPGADYAGYARQNFERLDIALTAFRAG
jgi:thiamine kinase-like enzyme